MNQEVRHEEQDKSFLMEQIASQQDMYMRATSYMQCIQNELDKSKRELEVYSRNLEEMVTTRTEKLRLSNLKLQEEVRQRKKKEAQLANLNNELNNLIYRSAHDLKNPVCSAKGIANLIRMETKDPLLHAYLDMLDSSHDKLLNILNILNKLASPAGEIKREPVVVIDILLEIVSELCEKMQIPFPLIKFKGRSEMVELPMEIVRPVLVEVLKNALIFLKQEQERAMIDIELKETHEYLMLFIKDHGMGLADKYLSSVFTMFFRGHLISGTGLGLFTSKKNLEKIGGRLRFSSIEGKGATVRIKIPIYH